jgi:hypothetical protein
MWWDIISPIAFFTTGTNITFSEKDMDVNEYERLSNITLRHKLK